jgi:hypothetical protein
MLRLRERFIRYLARCGANRGLALLLGAVLAVSSMAFASGGPDSLGYCWLDSDGPGGPVYKWTEIRDSGTALGNGDDDASWVVALPQPFWYYGVSYPSLHICTNGFASFTSTATNSYAPTAGFPCTDQPNACFAPYWNDMKLDPSPASGLYYYYDTLNRHFIVEWDSVRRFYGPLDSFRFSFQAVLDFADSSVLFFYRHANTSWQETYYLPSKVGIENQDGSVGLDVDWNRLHDGYALRFFHLPDSHDVKAVAVSQPGRFIDPNSPISCQLLVTNLGLAAESFPVTCEIAHQDTVVFSDIATVTDLAPGESLSVSFSPWTAGDAGEHYLVRAYCQLGNDHDPANDTAATQSVSFVYQDKLISAWRAQPIIVDGVLSPGEWADTGRVDISDVLSIHGMAPSAGSAFIYAANDSTRLFLAVDVPCDNTLEDGDALFLYMDDDGDGAWAGDSSEGQYQLTRTGAADSLAYTAFPNYETLAHTGISYAVTGSAGHVQYELSIPLGNSQPCFIANVLGGNCRLHCLWINGADFGIYGWWPQVLEQYQDEDPMFYGTLSLAGAAGVTVRPHDTDAAPALAIIKLTNAPNPFRQRTTIGYQLPAAGPVTLRLFNIAGQCVETMVNESQHAGPHAVNWNANGRQAAGIYFYRLSYGGQTKTGKMQLVK